MSDDVRADEQPLGEDLAQQRRADAERRAVGPRRADADELLADRLAVARARALHEPHDEHEPARRRRS